MEEKMKRPPVSVIIPVYNVGEKIARAQQSIASQGLKDAEYIFVDDCSTDDFRPAFLQWMAARQEEGQNIRLVRHERNQGVAAARNTGLDNATGEYIYFLDADDYLDSQALGQMYETAVRTSADIVGIEWNLTFDKNERPVRQADASTGKELFDNFCYGVARWNLWLFMVRRELFDGLRFTPGDNMGEDMMAMLTIAWHSGKVEMIHQPFYHYVQTNSGALTQNWNDDHRRQVTANLERAAAQIGTSENHRQLQCMKLTLKLPLLISDKSSDFERWQQWWPEANAHVGENPRQSWRTRMLERSAAKRRYRILKAYYRIVIKFVYGVLYK